jgi:hypothetical protein
MKFYIKFCEHQLYFSIKYSIPLCVIILSTTEIRYQSITTIRSIMRNYIWLHVSTFKQLRWPEDDFLKV